MNKDESFVVEIVSGENPKVASKQSKNINVQAAIIHVIGDFVQSVGVLVAAILIKIKVWKKMRIHFYN
jgi:Co/Zn/Cd efflux system component